MRRKRFKHHLDTIIDILNGYKILLDYDNFARKGLGKYDLELLSGNLFFNGKKIKQYHVFNFIYYWFNEDLKKHNISKQFIKTASVTLIIVSKLYQTRNKFSYFLWGKNLICTKNSAVFITKILVHIVTDEIEYRKQSQGSIFN